MISKLRQAGSYQAFGDECEEYYFYDGEKYRDKLGNELSDEVLKEWALWLNSPWSYAHFGYDVRWNCKDSYSEPEKDAKWQCTLTVVGYDGATATLTAYDDSEIEALLKCKKQFNNLQQTYNPKDESV